MIIIVFKYHLVMYIYIDNILCDVVLSSVKSWIKTKKFKIGINNNGSIIKRKQLWFQKNLLPFNKNWEKYDRWCSEDEYDDILIMLESIIKKHLIENNINININSCLVNEYTNGSDFIKFHQDSNKAFGDNFYTVILSIGNKRTLRFRGLSNNTETNNTETNNTETNNTETNNTETNNTETNIIDDIFDIQLDNNSLCICTPEINKKYEHSIIKDDSVGFRHSFTFREFINL